VHFFTIASHQDHIREIDLAHNFGWADSSPNSPLSPPPQVEDRKHPGTNLCIIPSRLYSRGISVSHVHLGHGFTSDLDSMFLQKPRAQIMCIAKMICTWDLPLLIRSPPYLPLHARKKPHPTTFRVFATLSSPPSQNLSPLTTAENILHRCRIDRPTLPWGSQRPIPLLITPVVDHLPNARWGAREEFSILQLSCTLSMSNYFLYCTDTIFLLFCNL
jgi:hypothetical protein